MSNLGENENYKWDMSLGEYQEQARLTAIYPENIEVLYPLIGLAGEAGEMLNKFKKVLRDGIDVPREELVKELGDVLWYVAMIAYDLKVDLEYVAVVNLDKLADRKARDVLGGSGDNR